MKFPETQESRAYGNPEDVYAAKQAAEANRARRAAEAAANEPMARRRTLTVRKGWHARKAAELLFAPEPVRASSPATPRNVGHAGGIGKDSHD